MTPDLVLTLSIIMYIVFFETSRVIRFQTQVKPMTIECEVILLNYIHNAGLIMPIVPIQFV